MTRSSYYWIANLCFFLLLAVGSIVGSHTSAHPLYLMLLFAICSTPVLNVTRLNDRYAILTLFSIVYFQLYGTVDLINLFTGTGQFSDSGAALSMTEMIVLVGGALAQIAYRMTCRSKRDHDTSEDKDWSEFQLVILGGAIWAISTAASGYYKIFVITAQTAAAVEKGMNSISSIAAAGFILANYMQYLGILFLAYAQCRYRRAYLIPVVVAVAVIQLAFGFIVDSKGDALIGGILVIVAQLFVNGRVPKTWLVPFIVFLFVAFPVMQANRLVRGIYRIDHIEALNNIGEILKDAIRFKDDTTVGGERSLAFYERMSLKGSVEMIVTRTGQEVEYQRGYTLLPLVTVFIPRLIWPSKPDVQTGLIMNREFKVSKVAFVYISPSHLGELYWNFGWPGVLIGMSLIGAVLGFIGKYVDMSEHTNITRLLIAVLTIRQLIIGFEGSIAVQYVVWMRAGLLVFVLHLLISRRIPSVGVNKPAEHAETNEPNISQRLPNLLR